MFTSGFNANHLNFLLEGALWTVVLSLISFIGGGLGGALVALARISSWRPLRYLAIAYIQIIQGTPLLVILFLSYFGLSIMGLTLPPLVAAGLSMTIYVSAYLGEIWRGSIQSVARTQWEAAECLALSRWQRLSLVILPQAVRIATPPTVGFMVQIIKNTSLASIVGFVELVRAGQLINNSIFQPFLIYVLIAALYFALCYPLSAWSRRLEMRLHFAHRPVQK
ncbi:amino acid ABC transporter permease [Alcaligenes faecalis]|jgi:polar amino acid transport system permease protein|uniref:Amino acid ABC transporter permease n=1 Tax=Alcaligenes faecalis TaxID=511 RepID=A0ABY7N0J4_ALCFA|nr:MULTISPECIES: amino acid ABC transporter permease [Alcaligenes]ARP54058.1 amino acid ABC transporter permease [Alcaligenes faecalis]ATI00039.1 amino acid ABC transporter permease [Alcaligenes faecalis]AYZ92825.1 amino acid ABC transporter permease [Alcaligenes faecalis]KAA1288844.1 amino acid ABC transporter permease [Alcaligenes faecalis]MBH0310501.1 amino acid ABC transporter permease [Alcaligenes faecalis]